MLDIFHRTLLWALPVFIITIAGCSQNKDLRSASDIQPKAQIANPASVYCIESGGKLVIKKHKDGSEYGVCVFKDYKECEEWAMFRGECPVGGIDTKTFTTHDPFRYCSVIGTIDAPDKRYTGDNVPDTIITAMIKQGLVSADAPAQFKSNIAWRCMDYRLWVCLYGANIPCTDKADASRIPSSEMNEYCRTNPSSDNIPAYITGRTTIYAWRCTDGKPRIVKQIHQVDHEGYIKTYWYELRER